jgi:SAM-dependent methyltransferase
MFRIALYRALASGPLGAPLKALRRRWLGGNTRRDCPVCSAPGSLLREVYDDRYGYPGRFPLFRCASCGHRYLHAPLSPPAVEKLYTEFYPRKTIRPEDVSALGAAEGLRGWFAGARQAAHYVPARNRVLDVGCGMGETLLFHRARGSEAIGIEADQNAQRAAQAHGLEIVQGVFREGLFPAASFDYVTMDQVLEHLPAPETALREARRLLRPGGRVVLSTPHGAGMGPRLFGSRWLHWHAPYHLHYFSRRSLDRLARDSGFVVERIFQQTPSIWLLWQWHHLARFPREGEPSAFWDASRAKPGADWGSKVLLKVVNLLHRAGLISLAARALDLTGWGDNWLVILKKRE